MEKPTITADGLTLYANWQDADDAGGLTTAHIYASTRATTAVDFPAPAVVSSIFLPGGFERDPFITADGATLYFMAFYDLYTAAITADGGFVAPQMITAASSAGDVQGGPMPSADGLTLYFFSSRNPGGPDAGPGADNNIWVSRRATTSDAFGAPLNAVELSTPANDEPVWLSADGCTLWFASTVTASDDAGPNDGNTHVFQAARGR